MLTQKKKQIDCHTVRSQLKCDWSTITSLSDAFHVRHKKSYKSHKLTSENTFLITSLTQSSVPHGLLPNVCDLL